MNVVVRAFLDRTSWHGGNAIAGRAGRKGTAHETGLVCTRRKSDQDLLAAALATSSQDETEAQARLAPLFEQVCVILVDILTCLDCISSVCGVCSRDCLL